MGGIYRQCPEVLLDFGPTRSYTFTLSDDLEGWPNFVSGVRLVNMDEMLVRHGFDVNHRSQRHGVEDVTILMSVAWNDKPDRVELLIKLGADIEATDEEGKTALMYAACGSSHGAFDSLARAGARIDSKTFGGSTILHLAITETTSNASVTAFSSVCNVPSFCEVVRDADLTNIDLDAKDEDGHRAFDLLRIRNGPHWNEYCQSKGIQTHWWLDYDEEDSEEMERKGSFSHEEDLENEIKAICALEKLLHYIQEVQGVLAADQYPPLAEYLSRDAEDEVVPGAWPAY